MQPTYLIILVLAGASGLLAVQAAQGVLKHATRRVGFANARLRLIEGEGSSALALARIRHRRGLTDEGTLRTQLVRLRLLILHSGVNIPLWGVIAAMPVAATLLAALAWFWKGSAMMAVVGAVVGLVAPVLLLMFKAKKRRAKAVAQLPDALDVVIRSLGAGHPVPVALGLVAREMPDPIGSEFGTAKDEISFGSSVATAIGRMAERVDHEDFYLFAAMIRLQERTGGNLAELLRANADTIRARQTMRLRIKAASAEGRMGAMILNITPIAILIGVNAMAPDFYGDVEGHPWIVPTFVAVTVWMIIGNLVIRRMVNFRV